jgi:hypothetical protein
MGGGPAYMGGGTRWGRWGVVGCGIATLIGLVIVMFLAFNSIHVFCPGGHCPGPPPDTSATQPVSP